MRQRAKFNQNRSKGCSDLTVFSCLPAWIFEIQFLTVSTAKRTILHHRNKFRKYRSNRCEDIAIFVILKMAAADIVNFQKVTV